MSKSRRYMLVGFLFAAFGAIILVFLRDSRELSSIYLTAATVMFGMAMAE